MFFTFLLSSCSMEKYCNSHYPPQISDSVVTVISYECEYDTIRVPYQEISFDTSFLPEDILFHHEEKQGSLTAYIDINKGKLTFKCAEDSLQFIIESQNKIINTSDHRVKMFTVKEFEQHWYYTPLIWWFFFTLICIIIWIVWKYLKLYAKI